MTPERGDAELPRWGGVTEPATVATDLVLAVLAFVFAARLTTRSASTGSAAVGLLTVAMLTTGVAALVGALAHGTDPASHSALRERFWRAALYGTGFVSAACVASVAFFAARGNLRMAIIAFAAIKLVVYEREAARRPEFRIAAVDYGVALAIVLAGATYHVLRGGAPGMTWLIGGVLVSLAAAVVQARGLAPHRRFNHNDLYHVIQMIALYSFYRGGALLVDLS